jgi:hypothetical protein
VPTASDVIAPLLELRDPLGVLSVYVDADPTRRGRRPEWEVEIRHQIDELRERVKREQEHARWKAIHDALDALEDEIAEAVEPAVEGRGRALFAPLSGGPPRRVRLQLRFPNLVVLEEDAYLAPLVSALDEARPTGILNVARDGLRAVQTALGQVEEVAWLGLEVGTNRWRDIRGTPGHRPAGGGGAAVAPHQSGSAQKDRFERRLEDHQIRFVKDAAGAVEELARAHGWERLVLVGDPRLTGPLREALPASSPFELLELEGTQEWRRPHELVEAVAPELERVHRRRELELVREALDRAAAGGAGAAGPAAVLDALIQGRVETLLIESGRRLAGVRAPDGRLAPEGAVPEGARAEDLTPEPHLVERMTELALGSSGEAVTVEGEAAEALARAGGVAAILRW